MTENKQLREQALEALEGRWGLAIGTYLIYTLITMATNAVPYAGIVVLLIIGGPLAAGLARFSLAMARRSPDAKLEMLFEGFNKFERYLMTYLWMCLYILPWLLLLIVPGIIKAIGYSQTFFIMADDQTIEPKEALHQSERMMKGKKMKLFLLGLSFLGWALLCVLTLGIGFLFLIPYINVTVAKFYDDIRELPVVTPQPEPVQG